MRILFQNVWGGKLWTCSLVFSLLSHLRACYASLIGKFLEWQFKRALPRHFYCFPAKTEKSFFLTFTRAENIALKFRTKT